MRHLLILIALILIAAVATVTVAFRVLGHRRLALQSERRRDWRAEVRPLLPEIVALAGAQRLGLAQQIISRHPELLEESGDSALGELADAIRDGDMKGGLGLAADCLVAQYRDQDTAMRNIEESRQLLVDCRRLGVEEAFAQIRILRPGRQQASLYEATRNPKYLRRAIKRYRQAVGRAGDGQPAAMCMDELAGSLVAWHRHLLKDSGADAPGAREALKDAIDWDRRAVEKSVPHSVERAAYESNLGLALRLRYAYTGNLADLNKAIALHREAVGFADQANPYRHAWLTNLGNALYDRFFVTASLADLDEAIKQYREALRLFEAHPGEAAVRQQHLRSLAGCLITRCSTRADERRAEADRDEAVKALAEVYMLAEGGLEPSATEIAKGVADLLVTQWSGSPASRLPPTASRDHLEELLMQRLFERTRQLDARSAEGFEETVRDLRAARDRTTAGSAGWAILNIHLARALRDRAEASGTSGLLQTAVGTYRNVCRRGQGTSLHYVMEAALEWGTWASGKEKWREAVEAFGYGLNAMEDLSATQEARANKEIWLARARTLSAEGAYAAAQANLPGWAVSSLDRGRAVIMREIMREVQDSKPDAEALLPDAAEPSTRIQFDAKAVARNDRGLILLKRGETAKAIKAFEAAVQADPGDYEAHNNLGRAYHAAGRTVDAVREFERAIDLNPDYPDPYNNLGVYYRQARDLDQAIARYRKALEILPDYAEAHHNLGLALIDAGHMSQGTQHLDIAGQLGVSASRRWQNRVA